MRDYIIPTWCPLCERVMRSSACNSTWLNWGCCIDCFIAFVEHREERWKSGWRPTPEEVDSYYFNAQSVDDS